MSKESFDPAGLADCLRRLQDPEPPEEAPLPLVQPSPLLRGIVAKTIAELTNPKVPDTADEFGDPEITDHRLRIGVNLLALLANTRFHEGAQCPTSGKLGQMSYDASFLSRAFLTREGAYLTIFGHRLQTPSRTLDMPVRQWAFECQSPRPSGQRPTVQSVQAYLRAEQGIAECPSPDFRHYRIEDWTFDYYSAPMLVEEFRAEPHAAAGVAQLLNQLQNAASIDDGPMFVTRAAAGHMFAWQHQ